MGYGISNTVEEHAKDRFRKYGSEELAGEMLRDFRASYKEFLNPLDVEAGACIVALYHFGLWPEAMFDDKIDKARREIKRSKDLFLNVVGGKMDFPFRYMSYLHSIQKLLKRDFSNQELKYLDHEINNGGYAALGDLAADIYNMISSREKVLHLEALSKTSGTTEEGIRRRAEMRGDIVGKKVLNSQQS
ncbi:MAG TPA: hypothetical protein VJH90_00075 [archaeon]|nr:hypothetical protein [archaeon]